MWLLDAFARRAQAKVAPTPNINELADVFSDMASTASANALPRLAFQPSAKMTPPLARAIRPRAKKTAATASCTVQLNVRVSPEMRDALHAIAETQGVRISELVRPCLARLIARHRQ